MTYYTTLCAVKIYNLCEKEETALRITYTIPDNSLLKHKHFLFHDFSQVDTVNEYGVLGKLNKITYWKKLYTYIFHFENKDIEIDDVHAEIFMYENIKR